MVTENKRDPLKIDVVFGFQFESQYYSTNRLKRNVQKMFQTAVNEYNKLGNSIILEFAPLRGGYGHHLFNKIARDIISSDIAVFDASEALENFTSGIYDLVILDVKMPRMSGFSLHKKIRELDDKVTICFLTAADEVYYEILKKCYHNIDETCVIRKPVDNDSLLRQIKSKM